MSSESTPAAALERLVKVAAAAAQRNAWLDLSRPCLNDPQPIGDIQAAVLAVLPALADDLERIIVKPRNTPMFYRSEGMYAAARHLRSLVAAPADDPKDGNDG
jgi:hypothetical protein